MRRGGGVGEGRVRKRRKRRTWAPFFLSPVSSLPPVIPSPPSPLAVSSPPNFVALPFCTEKKDTYAQLNDDPTGTPETEQKFAAFPTICSNCSLHSTSSGYLQPGFFFAFFPVCKAISAAAMDSKYALSI